MDYFSLIVLIIVVFVFIKDKKIKTLDNIITENKIENLNTNIEILNKNLEIFNIHTNELKYNKIKKNLEKTNKEYILIKNDKINLNKEDIDTIIANYLYYKKMPCGFNLIYSYKSNKRCLKRIYIDIINYLNIFNKEQLDTYAIIMCKKSDFEQNEKSFKKNIISFVPTNITNVYINNEDIKGNKLKSVYIEKINNSNFLIILKLLLLIISGSYITSNLIYTLFNINNNFSNLILSLVIYFCYSYIIRYVYSSIGKRRIIATYIFPIYFLAYIIVSIYMIILKVIRKLHKS